MKLGLINSAWVQAGKGTAWGIEKTKEIGFDSIDIFADPLDIDAKERKLIKRECDAVGLPIISVACVAVGLIDFNPTVQRFHVDRCKKYLDFAAELGARNLLLVIGEYIWDKQVIPPEEQWQAGVTNVRTLGEHADALGLNIALEMEPFRMALLNSVPNMVRFIDDVANPRVQANLDISHLQLAHSDPKELRLLQGKATHIHISDCDGKVHGDLPPGRGVVDFASYLKEIANHDIESMSIELEYSPEPDQIVEWVTEAYTATDRLMREAGIERG